MTGALSSMTEETWDVARVLGWAQQDFGARGLESPRLEAELLLGHALKLDRIQLILQRDRPLSPVELGRVKELIKRRRRGEPMAYILGQREFFGLAFRVGPEVLVPRPDTETLVEVSLERTRPRSMHGALLDLCTGSGCVAIAFARQRRTWSVLGVDISEEALELAHKNALALGVVPKVSFQPGDLFEGLRPGVRFDLITANPPYIPTAVVEGLDVGVRDFEPRIALDGGTDGLDVVRRIIAGAPERLVDGGVLALELHFDQAERVRALLDDAGFSAIEVRRDFGGHERVLSASWGR